MDTKGEAKSRWINIMIKDGKDKMIFEKQMVLDETNIRIKPFFTLINEFWERDKSLNKYKKYFKKILYKKFGIPEYETLVDTEGDIKGVDNDKEEEKQPYIDVNKWIIEEVDQPKPRTLNSLN